jgi:hypothetical protein
VEIALHKERVLLSFGKDVGHEALVEVNIYFSF